MAVETIVLIGAMGSGKSSVGRRVAEHLGVAYYDNDEALKRRTGMSAVEYARCCGADALHLQEAAVLQALLASAGPGVVSAAASVVDDPPAQQALTKTTVVWLRGDPQVLAQRASGGTHRPFLSAAVALANRRAPAYAQVADHVVDVDTAGVEGAVAQVLARLQCRHQVSPQTSRVATPPDRLPSVD